MTELILMRHGRTTLANGVYCGSSDPALSHEGINETNSAIKHIAAMAPAYVYTSDMRRALQTAKLVAPQMEPIILPSLREMDFGDFEGLHAGDIQRLMPKAWQSYMDDYKSFVFPNGEAVVDFLQRAVTAVTDIAASHTGERTLIVTHKGVIMAVLSHYLHGDTAHAFCYDIRPAGWAKLFITNGFATLTQLM